MQEIKSRWPRAVVRKKKPGQRLPGIKVRPSLPISFSLLWPIRGINTHARKTHSWLFVVFLSRVCVCVCVCVCV